MHKFTRALVTENILGKSCHSPRNCDGRIARLCDVTPLDFAQVFQLLRNRVVAPRAPRSSQFIYIGLIKRKTLCDKQVLKRGIATALADPCAVDQRIQDSNKPRITAGSPCLFFDVFDRLKNASFNRLMMSDN